MKDSSHFKSYKDLKEEEQQIIKENLKIILSRKESYIVMDRSDLANRMKNYEKVSKTVLMNRTPVAIRL